MNLSNLIESLNNDECVLLLGPRAATYEGEYLQDLLSERFAKELKRQGIDISVYLVGDSHPTRYTTTQLVKLFLEQFKNPSEGLEQLGNRLRDFYKEFEQEEIPLYEQIAQLPFKYIINTSPDDLIVHALARQDKYAHFFDFHFSKPEYNAEMNRKAVDLDKEISSDSPLIYNLLGHFSRPDSIVMTDSDHLCFLEVVLQKEKEATLPANITYHFTRPPLKQMRKTYIFVGFDFNEWHLRLFMHLLRRTHEHLPHSFSLQEDKLDLREEVKSFYSENFNMHFVADNAADFFTALQEQLKTPAPSLAPAEIEVMLLYHPNDEALRREIEKYLATLRNSGLIDVWQECALGNEIETTIRQQLASARLIIPLVTADMLASDKLNEYLEIAVARHHKGEAKVCPILMKPCDIENTPLYELNTLFPKPKGKALSQKPDREQTLTNFAKDLRGIVELMLKKQKA